MKFAATAPRPSRLEAVLLGLLLVFFAVLCVDTLIRSAFMDRPMTDAQVFFRAGWAIREGVSIYGIADDNGWPFVYPPTFAILMAPFAVAPAGEAALAAIPYPVSIVILYLVELVAGLWAVHAMASAYEKSLPFGGETMIEGGFTRWHAWWFLRLGPLAAYVPLFAEGIARGQVTTLIMASVAGFAVLLVAGRSFWAGFVLSIGFILKLFPLIALGLPILRRDFACIAGFLAGILVFAVLLPLGYLGWDRFVAENLAFLHLIAGISQESGNSAGAAPGVMTLDAIGYGSVVYKTVMVLTGGPLYGQAPDWVSIANLAILLAFLAAFTLAAWGISWRLLGAQPRGRMAILVSCALLFAVMAPAAPVSQLHYLTLGVFLHMGLVALVWLRGDPLRVPGWLYALGGAVFVAAILNQAPSFGRFVWVTPALYPVAATTLIGFVMLRREKTSA